MRLVVLLAVLLSGCAATVRPVASVTDVPPLGPTAQVVLADGRILHAPNLRTAPDSVRWDAGDGTLAAVPTCAVVELRRDERYGDPPQARTGITLGAILGAALAVGATVATLTRADPPPSGLDTAIGVGIGIGLGGPGFAFAGAMFGGIAGGATAPIERYPLAASPCPHAAAPSEGSRLHLR